MNNGITINVTGESPIHMNTLHIRLVSPGCRTRFTTGADTSFSLGVYVGVVKVETLPTPITDMLVGHPPVQHQVHQTGVPSIHQALHLGAKPSFVETVDGPGLVQHVVHHVHDHQFLDWCVIYLVTTAVNYVPAGRTSVIFTGVHVGVVGGFT